MQRRQPHLGAIADEKEHKGGFEPGVMELRCVLNEVVHDQRQRRAVGLDRGNRQKKVAKQRQRDAHGTDQQIFPGRFEGPMVAMKENQRRARQRGRFNRDPQEAEVLTLGHERHGRQEQQQTARESRFRRSGKQEALLEVRMGGVTLAAEIGHTVQRRRQEQDARNTEEDSADRIQQ